MTSGKGETVTSPTSNPLSLVDFVKAERRKDCGVCKLPDDLRDQMRKARDKKILRATILDWLRTQYGFVVTTTDMDVHINGHHDV